MSVLRRRWRMGSWCRWCDMQIEKDLTQLAKEVADLAERARSKKLSPEEVQGGTFTITNHGGFGSLFSTPIIHQPQIAILGVGAIQKRAMVLTMTPLRSVRWAISAMSFDHRVIDGATADQFMAKGEGLSRTESLGANSVNKKQQAVIVSAVRTPMGSFNGVFSPVPATKLGSIAVTEALKRINLRPDRVDEVYMGCVLSAGLGQAPARQASIGAGHPQLGGRHDGQQGLRVQPQNRDHGLSEPLRSARPESSWQAAWKT